MSRMDAWSRRKAAVAAEADAVDVALSEQSEAQLAARDDQDLLSEAGMPEPETLDSPEAVREFMNSALPQRLKTRALRRLWRLNPMLANLDGLVDYGEDYTDAATVVENLQTAYQVGKGMLTHIEALAAKAEDEAQAKLENDAHADADADNDVVALDAGAEDTAVSDAEVDPPLINSAPQNAVFDLVDSDAATDPTDMGADVETYAPTRRRMAFSFTTSPNVGAA